ncbi:unnamed protein product [Heligmosomoides polygyrus]|uniref:Gelsolin-like domain-containing protein n=1 Tax=Heligmosomoides polygyrus TaxID=6339 RepID=A0A183GTW3_HELPZ|nr:unnamed protein product [Heligmosomoides polygyrus]
MVMSILLAEFSVPGGNDAPTVKRKRFLEGAHFDSIDSDGLQCLFYVAGFKGPEFADNRRLLLWKLHHAERITLKDFTFECQLIKSYKEDARLFEGTPAVNAVRRQNFQLGKVRKPKDDNEKSLHPKRFSINQEEAH